MDDVEHPDDIALAQACLAGDAEAIATFERTALLPAGAHARRSGLPEHVVDDALQLARIKLLVGDGEDRPPRLGTYRGRGPLVAFVRTAVTRIAIDQQRRRRETSDDHVVGLLAAPSPDPELEYMRAEYGSALAAALRLAWEGLAAHDRFILGLMLHERLDLGAIAKVYDIHRATAARRVASARAALLTLTRTALLASLSIGEGTLESILRIVSTSVAWPVVEL